MIPLTKVKMCGLRRPQDIEYANELLPDYIGYVFAKKSKRYVTPEDAAELTKLLDPNITPVGVFVDEPIENVIELVKSGTIKIAQLHGSEDEAYINALKDLEIPVIKAFVIASQDDVDAAENSPADWVLLDSGQGSGEVFDHSLLKKIRRQYFLAGGLSVQNVRDAVDKLSPFAVDVSSGIETDGFKDVSKMSKFINEVYSVNI